MKKLYFTAQKMPIPLQKISLFVSYGLASTFPSLARKFAIKYLFNPFSRRQYQFRNVEPPQDFSIASKLGDIHLMKFGNGKKQVLLTHGWGDTSLRFSALIKALLDADYTVWSFDHYGHGKSHGNYGHLFACIEGLKVVNEHIHAQGYRLDKIVSHSMGGLALLNMPSSFLADKTIISLSLPVYFFDAMYQKLDDFGISRKVMTLSLDHFAGEFNAEWEQLDAKNHRSKITADFTYIHDENDEFANFDGIQKFLKDSDCQFISTQNLGHNGIVKDSETIKKIVTL